MSLSKDYSKIWESHRSILTLRMESLEAQRKVYIGFASQAIREGVEDLSVLHELTIGYIDSEILAIDYLRKLLDETQQKSNAKILEWEAIIESRKISQ